jgi:hypothetical protein
MRALSRLGMSVRMVGDGIVVSQDPAPGTPVDPDRVCRLVLGRDSARAPGESERMGQP